MSNSDEKKSLSNTITNLPIINESKKIPVNIEAERALLGSIITNNKAFESVENILIENDFSEPQNRMIYSFISKLIGRGQIADLNTLKTYLDDEEFFSENGSLEYLLKICENSLSIINANHYAKVIKELSQRRQLIDVGTKLVNDSFSYNLDIEVDSLIERTEQNLYELTTSGLTENGPRKFDDVILETMNYAEKAFKKDEDYIGIKTGLSDFDHKIGGLHNSDLIIVAGRPSMGKTAFATNIAYNITKNSVDKKNTSSDKNVLIFSLEMSSEQLATRILSELSEIPSEKIRTGNINKNDFSKVLKSSEELSSLSLFIDDSPALTIASIRTRARRLKRKSNLDLIIVDYLQLISGNNQNSNDNRVKEISDITRGLKAIAKELNLPVIALSQLSRKVEDREEKRPQLSDLRESGAIEQDADLVVFLYREEYYLARSEPTEGTEKHDMWMQKMSDIHNVAEAIIAKHRHGPISKVKLHFNASSTKFSDFVDNNSF